MKPIGKAMIIFVGIQRSENETTRPGSIYIAYNGKGLGDVVVFRVSFV